MESVGPAMHLATVNKRLEYHAGRSTNAEDTPSIETGLSGALAR